MTVDEWVAAAALWATLWPRHPLPDYALDSWYDLLEDLDADAVVAALRTMAADPDNEWPPASPGQIREAAAPPETDWATALGNLARMVRRSGRYGGKPDLDDPALDAYVDSMGGWVALCDHWDASSPTVRAQFRDAYVATRKRLRAEDTRRLASAVGDVALPSGTGGRPVIGAGDA